MDYKSREKSKINKTDDDIYSLKWYWLIYSESNLENLHNNDNSITIRYFAIVKFSKNLKLCSESSMFNYLKKEGSSCE